MAAEAAKSNGERKEEPLKVYDPFPRAAMRGRTLILPLPERILTSRLIASIVILPPHAFCGFMTYTFNMIIAASSAAAGTSKQFFGR